MSTKNIGGYRLALQFPREKNRQEKYLRVLSRQTYHNTLYSAMGRGKGCDGF
jgi:hypothetical protein